MNKIALQCSQRRFFSDELRIRFHFHRKLQQLPRHRGVKSCVLCFAEGGKLFSLDKQSRWAKSRGFCAIQLENVRLQRFLRAMFGGMQLLLCPPDTRVPRLECRSRFRIKNSRQTGCAGSVAKMAAPARLATRTDHAFRCHRLLPGLRTTIQTDAQFRDYKKK